MLSSQNALITQLLENNTEIIYTIEATYSALREKIFMQKINTDTVSWAQKVICENKDPKNIK